MTTNRVGEHDRDRMVTANLTELEWGDRQVYSLLVVEVGLSGYSTLTILKQLL